MQLIEKVTGLRFVNGINCWKLWVEVRRDAHFLWHLAAVLHRRVQHRLDAPCFLHEIGTSMLLVSCSYQTKVCITHWHQLRPWAVA